jgi:hypothetical protein
MLKIEFRAIVLSIFFFFQSIFRTPTGGTKPSVPGVLEAVSLRDEALHFFLVTCLCTAIAHYPVLKDINPCALQI